MNLVPQSVVKSAGASVTRLEWVAAFTFLLYGFQPAMRLVGENPIASAHDYSGVPLQLAAYALITIGIGKRWKEAIRSTFSLPCFWIVLVTGIAIMSTLWSDVPSLTFRRSLTLLINEFVAIYLIRRFREIELERVLVCVLSSLLIASAIAIVAFPDFGKMPRGFDDGLRGSWRGVFEHKNILGKTCALSSILFFLRFRKRKETKWLWAAIACVGILVGSRSTTSVIALIVSAVAALAYRALAGKHPVSVLIMLAGVSGAGLSMLWTNFFKVVDALGKNATLTGRIPLWISAVVLGTRRNPWLGYGFAGFWRGYDGDSAIVWKIARWPAPNIHNGYVDLWLILGVAGLLPFLIGHFLACWVAFRNYRKTISLDDLWPLMFLTFFTIVNLAESVLLNIDSSFWMIYVAMVYYIFERRRKLRFSPVKIASLELDVRKRAHSVPV